MAGQKVIFTSLWVLGLAFHQRRLGSNKFKTWGRDGKAKTGLTERSPSLIKIGAVRMASLPAVQNLRAHQLDASNSCADEGVEGRIPVVFGGGTALALWNPNAHSRIFAVCTDATN